MYIDNYFRDMEEEDICIYDPNEIYELEVEDLPPQCPYRQMVSIMRFPQGSQQPPSPPPNFTPQQPQAQQFGTTSFAVDQGAIQPCLFRFVYIWPRRGRGFWAWLVFVGRRSVSGFRWNMGSWRYFGMDLRQISSFQCF
ncbi:hypothetical protein [Clostridium thermarum]|uniref:hypothetical protein n=1 Tax=Clostridium thermarum TaxID=1716543 RepID=UPI001FACB403|nr:hypothetical protein [Clostridium thermarum]